MKAPEYCIDCYLTKPSACGATHGLPHTAIPGPECPLVLLDAANAENEILRQRNLSDPLIQATTKHLQAEIEQLHESLAAKERECERLRADPTVCTCETPTPEMANPARCLRCTGKIKRDALAEEGE